MLQQQIFSPAIYTTSQKKLDLDDEYGMTSPIQTFTIYLGRDRPYSILSWLRKNFFKIGVEPAAWFP